MKLSALARACGAVTICGSGDPLVKGLSEDSRKTKKGDLFFALPGSKVDGSAFARQAVARGAAALVVQDKPLENVAVPQVLMGDVRRALADAAHLFFGRPSSSVAVYAVTGTKGKTTTSYLLRSLLDAAGLPSGLIGTVAYETGKRSYEAGNTTPSSLRVASLLSEMRAARMKACAMEVSSHALEMDRVRGVEFRGAVFTNLSREHLDYHRTFPKYFEAKKRLFTEYPSVRHRVVNADDPWGRKLLASLRSRAVGFGLKSRCAYRASSVVIEPHRILFRLRGRDFEAPLSGTFNLYNSLGALALLREAGLSWESLARGLKNAPAPPGRFERVEAGQPFTVLVDYAHSPGALKEALREARRLAPRGSRVISVFGCGGDRDRTKRPVMGHLSASLADATFLTSDNPRTENPKAILDEILKGIPASLRRNGARKLWVEADRAKAVRAALSAARPGDVVLIAGKGHENYQILGDRKVHFDDREQALKALSVVGYRLSVKAGK